MSLKGTQKKQLRTLGHNLNPVVLIAENGLSEGVVKEADRALTDHELIKIRFNLDDRDERNAMMAELADQLQAELIQTIGKIGLYYRAARKPNPKLSNLLRFAE